MQDTAIANVPTNFLRAQQLCADLGFTMPSDALIGSLLRTLVASRPEGDFLELGTGVGLSLAWLADGLKDEGHLISIDNDPELSEAVSKFYEDKPHVELVCADGGQWLKNYDGPPFDLIFADVWPGKYHQLDEALALLKPGGFYVIDDMLPRASWPAGHAEKATNLIATLEARNDLELTKLGWSSGVIIATKRTAVLS